jgi:hypothetical protein
MLGLLSTTTIVLCIAKHQTDLQRLIDVGIETAPFAKSMGNAFALMHWHSRLNTRDVDFVRGAQPGCIHDAQTANAELKSKEPLLSTPPQTASRS